MMLQRFLRDRRAGVAPAFAAAVIPIFGLLGAAVDYSRASAARTSIQSAFDSTALAMSKDAPNLTAAQLQASASSYFNALLNRPEIQGVTVTATYSTASGSQLALSASGAVKTLFMAMWPFNVSEMAVGASSTSTWGMTRLRVALVLDNTGSMSQTDNTGTSKISALKTASKNLITQLKNAAQKDGDVYVSIVPFAKDVNADPANYTQSWIDWTSWDAWSKDCAANYDPTKSSERTTASSKCAGSFTNTGTQQKPKWTWTVDHSKWNGCVMDRDQNYDTLNTAPGAGTLFPAEQYGSCPVAQMPLSYDWTALTSKIDAMTPNGSTNQAIGLAWGWQSLTSTAPLNAPATDPNYQYQQVIILLSDGLNTQDRWYGDGANTSSQVDTRMQKTCDNIKADQTLKVTVYTVLVMAGNSNVLKNCASDAGKYFALTTAGQIVTTFDAIGTNLSRLRIAQ